MCVDPFAPISGEAFDLQTIKVEGEGLGAGQVQLQTMTTGGETDQTFLWIPTDEAGDYDMEAEGWFNPDEWAQAEKTVAVGEGLVTMNDFGEGATITFDGEVTQGATEVPVAPLVSTSGNCTPVAIDIQSIVVTGEGLAAGQIQMQTLTSGGETDKTFYWIPEEEAGDYDMEGEGWFNPDEWAQAEYTIAAGEGVVLMNDFGEGATIKFPSPLE